MALSSFQTSDCPTEVNEVMRFCYFKQSNEKGQIKLNICIEMSWCLAFFLSFVWFMGDGLVLCTVKSVP
jgi:hypothetical protein